MSQGVPDVDPQRVRDQLADATFRNRKPTDPATIGGIPREPSGNPKPGNDAEKPKKYKNPIIEVSVKAYAETQKDWWSKTLYLLYILPLLLLFLLLALLLAPPWTTCRFVRPYAPDVVDKEDGKRHRFFDEKGRRKRMNFDKYDADANFTSDIRDVTARIGKGPEIGLGFWAFWLRRTWDMYELIRELLVMVYRQGLQVGGQLSGLAILVMQVWIMVHDYSESSVSVSPVGFGRTTFDQARSGKSVLCFLSRRPE